MAGDRQTRQQSIDRARRNLRRASIILDGLKGHGKRASRRAEWRLEHEAEMTAHEALMKRIDNGLVRADRNLKILLERDRGRQGGPETWR
jgi:hypothetical protein